MTDCTNCDSYNWECHVEPEDWYKPCPFYKPIQKEEEVQHGNNN